MSPSFAAQVFQVFRAELFRHLKVARWSLLVATFILPPLTIFSIYFLPGMDVTGLLQLQTAAITVVSGPPGSAPVPGLAQHADTVVQKLTQQPYYEVHGSADARAEFEAGRTDLAVVLSATPDRTGYSIDLYRKNDFVSELFADHLRDVARAVSGDPTGDKRGARVEAADRPEIQKQQSIRSGLTRVAPFILLGFAWFFMTVGMVEALVVERERRTLEHLLAASVDKTAVAWGKLSFVLAQSAGPQLTAAAALLILGFSPWLLLLTGVVLLALIPASVLAFALLRDLDNSMTAGWRNGLVFMLGFPMLILGDDVTGTLSPFFYVGKALEGQPYLREFGWAYGVVLVLAAVAVAAMPRLARRWSP